MYRIRYSCFFICPNNSQLKDSPGPAEDKRPPPVAKRPPRRKSRPSSSKGADKLKVGQRLKKRTTTSAGSHCLAGRREEENLTRRFETFYVFVPRCFFAPNTQRDQSDVNHQQTPSADFCTPAGVAKMLVKDVNKPTSKGLKRGRCIPTLLSHPNQSNLFVVAFSSIYLLPWNCKQSPPALIFPAPHVPPASSSISTTGTQSRQIKAALFIQKLQQSEREEQANHLKW